MPKAVKVFYPFDNPTGVREVSVELDVATGIMFPRNKLVKAKQRPLADKPGLYFLFGEDDADQRAYIGETSHGIERIETHRQQKDWWQSCALFTSSQSTNELNKSAVKYLEWKAISDAKDVQRFNVEQRQPRQPKLAESTQASLNELYSDIQLLLGVLNKPVFEPLKDNEEDVFTCSVDGYKARAQYTDDGMVVLQGSQARKETTPSAPSSLESRRDQLLEQDVLKDNGDHYEFTEDHAFSSPSTASSICLGRQTNGWTTWRHEHGKTLDDVYR